MEDFSKLTKKQLIEKLQAQTPPQEEGVLRLSTQEEELDRINRLSSLSNPHNIPFTVKDDHTNIMLYTALNKRVGPLHPDNARSTMVRWKKAGIQLYTRKRTDAEVEAFKQTAEYKKAHAKHLALRAQRHKQSGKGKTEQMIKDVAVAVAGAQNG